MSMAARHTYLAIRRFVDRDLKRSPIRSISPFLGFPPLIGAELIVKSLNTPAATLVWSASIAFSFAWTGFVVWRAFRLLKADGIKGDRRFDQKTKYELSAEYWTSESASQATRRSRKS